MLGDQAEKDYYLKFERKHGTPERREQKKSGASTIPENEITKPIPPQSIAADLFFLSGISVITPVDFDEHGIY